jgi:hypothetical protein
LSSHAQLHALLAFPFDKAAVAAWKTTAGRRGEPVPLDESLSKLLMHSDVVDGHGKQLLLCLHCT